MAAVARVARRDRVGAGRAPGRDDAIDRGRREVGTVGEDDNGGFDLRAERFEAAAKRRAGAALPVRTVDDPGVGVERVGAADHHDLVDLARAHALEHARQQQALLRSAEPGRGACREDDGGYVQRLTARRPSARASSTLYALPGSGWAASSASSESSAHGIGATPASARRTPFS
jgi:hypothetical protein